MLPEHYANGWPTPRLRKPKNVPHLHCQSCGFELEQYAVCERHRAYLLRCTYCETTYVFEGYEKRLHLGVHSCEHPITPALPELW